MRGVWDGIGEYETVFGDAESWMGRGIVGRGLSSAEGRERDSITG